MQSTLDAPRPRRSHFSIENRYKSNRLKIIVKLNNIILYGLQIEFDECPSSDVLKRLKSKLKKNE